MPDWEEDAREGEDLEAWTTRILGERADALSELTELKESLGVIDWRSLRLHSSQCAEIIRERFFNDPVALADLAPAEVLRYGEALNGTLEALGKPTDTDARVAMADAEDMAEGEDGDGEKADD